MKRYLFYGWLIAQASLVSAQTPLAGKELPTALPTDVYPGVTPGTSNPPPVENKLKHMGAKVVTWPGFQTLPDGTTRFFIQVWGNAKPKHRMRGRSMVITLPKAKIGLKNNKSPLVTTYFNTPVERAYLKQTKGGAEFHLEMRAEPVEGNVSVEKAGDTGYSFVYVTFPARINAKNGAQPATVKRPVQVPENITDETSPVSGEEPLPRSNSDSERPPLK